MRALLLLSLWLLWLVCPVRAVAAPPVDPWTDLPRDSQAAWAAVRQEILPILEARRAAAEARAADARAYFAGAVPLAVGFPDLSGARLDDPLVLQARLVALDDRAVSREAARVAPLPDLGGERRMRQARTALVAALDAEDVADGLARRLLLALRGHLALHPELTFEGLAPLRAEIAEALDAAIAHAEEAPDDPERAREVAALDAEAERLEAVVRQIRRRATVPLAPPVDPAPDLARLVDTSPVARRADQRLALLTPFAPDPSAVAAARTAWRLETWIPALEAELAALAADEAPSETELRPEELAARLADVEARLARARERVPEAGPEGSALDAAQARIAALEVEILERTRARIASSLAAAEHRESAARTAAQAARASEREALEEAERAESEATSALLTAVATAARRGAERFHRASNIEHHHADVSARADERIARLTREVADVLEAPPSLLGGRDPDPDAVYRAARQEIGHLRKEAARLLVLRDAVLAEAQATAEAIAQDRAALAAVDLGRPGSEERAVREEALARWRKALDDAEVAAALAVTRVSEAQDGVLADLRTLKQARRALRGRVSPEVRREDWESLVRDVRWEIALIGPNLLSLVHHQITAVVALPLKLLNPATLVELVRGSFRLLVLTGVWLLLRRRARALVDGAIARLDPTRRRQEHLELLAGPLVALTRAALDVGFGTLLREPLSSVEPLLGLAAWIYVQIALYRLCLAAFDLVVAPYGDARPSLVPLGLRAHGLARRTLQAVAAWAIGRAFVRQILRDALGADAIDTVVRVGIDVVALVGLVVLLSRWAPLLRARIRTFHQRSRWVRLLSSDPPLRLLDPFYAAVTMAYLSAAWLWDRVQRLARERRRVGRIVAFATRMTLPRSEDASGADRALPTDLRQALLGEPIAGDEVPRRASERLREAIARWDTHLPRGPLVLTGDVGDGRRVFLDRFLRDLDGDRPIRRVRLDRRLSGEADALEWLAAALDAPEIADGVDVAVAWLDEMSPSVLVVEDLERSFLRAVGGFAGLRTLLFVLNAACRRHVVLVTAHRIAWRYLGRLGSLVNVALVRETIDLEPLGEGAIRRLAMGRLGRAGWEARFAGLVRVSPFGVDPAVEVERATGAFFHLLSDAADGNPSVALHLFARCLVPVGDRKVAVRIHECLSVATLEKLTEDETFTLVALRTQAALSEDELVRVTNLGASTVRDVVRNLLDRDLLVRVGERVGVNVAHLPLVTRTLRRRHALHFVG